MVDSVARGTWRRHNGLACCSWRCLSEIIWAAFRASVSLAARRWVTCRTSFLCVAVDDFQHCFFNLQSLCFGFGSGGHRGVFYFGAIFVKSYWKFLSWMDVKFCYMLFLHLLRSYFLYIILLMWYITLIDLWILNHPCIPGINPIWSWCMIFLICCWTWFENTVEPRFSNLSHSRKQFKKCLVQKTSLLCLSPERYMTDHKGISMKGLLSRESWAEVLLDNQDIFFHEQFGRNQTVWGTSCPRTED